MVFFKHSERGFSLIELSVVLIIVGLISAGAFAAWDANLQKARVMTTKDKMAAIENAIKTYATNNGGLLPCPASREAGFGDVGFGTPTACGDTTQNIGSCANGVCVMEGRHYDDDNNPATPAVALRVRAGAVPARALNLPFEIMKDGYGRNFTYAVTENLAAAGHPQRAGKGAIGVIDDNGQSVIMPAEEAAYIIISHGPDGKGATDFASGAAVASCPAGSGKDVQNCPTSSRALFLTSLYSTSNDANNFDDMLTYATQVAPAAAAASTGSGPLVTIWGTDVCPPGWETVNTGRRFEMVGYDKVAPPPNAEASCVNNLPNDLTTYVYRNTNAGGTVQRVTSLFNFPSVGNVLLLPVVMPCAVCLKSN